MNLLTVKEVAEKLKVAASTIYKWKRRGILRAVKLSRKGLRFREKDLQDFIESKLVQPEVSSPLAMEKPFMQKKSSAYGNSSSRAQIERLFRNAQREVLGSAQ